MLSREEKEEIIQNFGRTTGDTGSPEVQIALLSHRIKALSSHLGTHAKDYDSRSGLLKLVGQRRSFLRYLMKNDLKKYYDVTERLGIRR